MKKLHHHFPQFNRYSRYLGIFRVILCIGLLFIVPTVGFVQASPQFGIGPVYQNDQYKGWLIYELKPGDTLDDEIFVANPTNKQIILRLYVQDALNTIKTGDGFKFLDEGKTPENMKFLSRWVSLEKSVIMLDPYSREKVKIKTMIPLAAEKREYAAVIFAHNDPGKDSVPQNVRTNQGDLSALIGSRVGLRQYIKVTDAPNMPRRYVKTNAASISIVEYFMYGIIGLMIIGGVSIIIADRRRKKL